MERRERHHGVEEVFRVGRPPILEVSDDDLRVRKRREVLAGYRGKLPAELDAEQLVSACGEGDARLPRPGPDLEDPAAARNARELNEVVEQRLWVLGRALSYCSATVSNVVRSRSRSGCSATGYIEAMKELLPDIDRWRARGEKIALATVVATRRTSPRPVGSKLAVSESGELAGSVSGGCVESDVVLAAQDVLQGGTARLITYGITDDMALEVGLPCGGEIDVFVERLE
jgi:hypothetical protein